MNSDIKIISTEYNKLSDLEINEFQAAMRELINKGFIVRSINQKLFNFIHSNQRLFYSALNIIGFRLHDRIDIDLYYIKTPNNDYVENINKDDAIILLVLRALYEEEKEKASLHNEIQIRYEQLNRRLVDVGYQRVTKDRVQLTHINETFRWLRNHNIIKITNKSSNMGLMDNSVITIYPSIEVILDFNEIDKVLKRLNKLVDGSNEDETN